MRKLLSVILALAMCASLVGCGASKPEETVAAAPETTAAPAETTAAPVVETFVESSHDLIRSSVEKARIEVERDPSILPSMKNREIVARLISHGVFQMKDSVSLVAEAMRLSKNTIYMHLRNLNKKI